MEVMSYQANGVPVGCTEGKSRNAQNASVASKPSFSPDPGFCIGFAFTLCRAHGPGWNLAEVPNRRRIRRLADFHHFVRVGKCSGVSSFEYADDDDVIEYIPPSAWHKHIAIPQRLDGVIS